MKNRTVKKGKTGSAMPKILLATLLGLAAIWSFRPASSTASEVTMYKNRGCQCCTRWAGHLRKDGHTIKEQGISDMDTIKTRYKIAPKFQSCHTALMKGYVIEGHVPMKEIRRLLSERPDAIGLSVPGMPMGSPGMEAPDRVADSYQVLLLKKDGSSEIYASY